MRRGCVVLSKNMGGGRRGRDVRETSGTLHAGEDGGDWDGVSLRLSLSGGLAEMRKRQRDILSTASNA
jgi:hypothetical protein